MWKRQLQRGRLGGGGVGRGMSALASTESPSEPIMKDVLCSLALFLCIKRRTIHYACLCFLLHAEPPAQTWRGKKKFHAGQEESFFNWWWELKREIFFLYAGIRLDCWKVFASGAVENMLLSLSVTPVLKQKDASHVWHFSILNHAGISRFKKKKSLDESSTDC